LVGHNFGWERMVYRGRSKTADTHLPMRPSALAIVLAPASTIEFDVLLGLARCLLRVVASAGGAFGPSRQPRGRTYAPDQPHPSACVVGRTLLRAGQRMARQLHRSHALAALSGQSGEDVRDARAVPVDPWIARLEPVLGRLPWFGTSGDPICQTEPRQHLSVGLAVVTLVGQQAFARVGLLPYVGQWLRVVGVGRRDLDRTDELVATVRDGKQLEAAVTVAPIAVRSTSASISVSVST
jgi:hypothetical protein